MQISSLIYIDYLSNFLLPLFLITKMIYLYFKKEIKSRYIDLSDHSTMFIYSQFYTFPISIIKKRKEIPMSLHSLYKFMIPTLLEG